MLNRGSLSDNFLSKLCENSIHISVFLVNGIKLQGYLQSFDEQVVIIKSNISQMIFRHAISTIEPTDNL